MREVVGGQVVADVLRQANVRHVFEVPGEPITPILKACRAAGIECYTFRHEQAASMAAQALSYARKEVGVAVVPSGPGMINAVTGLYTAWANCWPMLLIGGNGSSNLRGLGDFQEAPQVEAAKPFTKWATVVDQCERIPYFIGTAIAKAVSGRPGPVYLDFPADIISDPVTDGEVTGLDVSSPEVAPRALGDPVLIENAMAKIARASRPLLILGKGAAWSDCADSARSFVESLQLPFLPSPMGKGVIPDDHPLCFGGARSYALRNADLIVLIGARLNWIFHFGRPPRFAPDVKLIQVDIEPAELGNSMKPDVGIVGDADAVLKQLLAQATGPLDTTHWIDCLSAERSKNGEQIRSMMESCDSPMNLYRLCFEINRTLDSGATVVVDGEATQAVSRSVLKQYLPRHRLDSGVSGCMGVAVPYAIGAQVARPDKQVVCLTGDYAFGWSAMDVDTAVRHALPIVFVVSNNNTINAGVDPAAGPSPSAHEAPPTGYHKIMQAFGGNGVLVADAAELRAALELAWKRREPTLLNVLVDARSERKQQPYPWLARRGRMY